MSIYDNVRQRTIITQRRNRLCTNTYSNGMMANGPVATIFDMGGGNNFNEETVASSSNNITNNNIYHARTMVQTGKAPAPNEEIENLANTTTPKLMMKIKDATVIEIQFDHHIHMPVHVEDPSTYDVCIMECVIGIGDVVNVNMMLMCSIDIIHGCLFLIKSK